MLAVLKLERDIKKGELWPSARLSREPFVRTNAGEWWPSIETFNAPVSNQWVDIP